MTSVTDLVERLRAGDRSAVPRLISAVENGTDDTAEILRAIYSLTGRAMTVGLTGAPGAGKSTLVDGLAKLARMQGRTVGILAVDPTSPFSKGAFLGDRTRMQGHALDTGVYIRSMATRGHLGGLALAAPGATRILEAAGFDVVMIETVGVGQSEVEVAGQADTTVVVVAPGMGDFVQAAKAGILEVADIFCVNKIDRPGADEAARDLRDMIKSGATRDPSWTPPIVKTNAPTGEGVEDLWKAIAGHRAHLESSGRLEERRRARVAGEIREIVAERLRRVAERSAGRDKLDELVDKVVRMELDPYSAADALLDGLDQRSRIAAPTPNTTQ